MTSFNNFRILVDIPSRSPGLGFKETADGLTSLIHNSEPQFAIAVFGPWGSGKTTLMQAIKNELDVKTTISVDFSAWRYEREEHLIVPLLDTIRAGLMNWSELMDEESQVVDPMLQSSARQAKNAAISTAKTVGKVIASVLAGVSFKIGIPGALDLSYDASKALKEARTQAAAGSSEPDPRQNNLDSQPLSEGGQPGHTFSERLNDPAISQSIYHASFIALSEAFRDFEKEANGARIVVFVDDLDRCLPSGTLEVLESIKLFFDIPGFIFVVGLDRDVVERSVDAKYLVDRPATEPNRDETARYFQVIRGSDYLKKIFQVPFSLAPVSVDMLDDLFRSLEQDASLDSAQVDDLHDTVRPHMNYLFTETRLNPREVKRYINAYTIQMKVKPGLDADIVLALNTLAFRRDCESLYTAIATYREELIHALRDFITEDQLVLEDYDLSPADIPVEIRDYLGENGPANVLLTTTRLDDHIDAGEATRSNSGGYFLDILNHYRRFRVAVSEALADGAGDRQMLWSVVDKSFDELTGNLESFGASNRQVSEFKRIRTWVAQVKDEIRSEQTDVLEERIEPYRQQAQEMSSILLDNIRRMKRRGNEYDAPA